MYKPELLSPAGSFEVAKAALYAGCDAIYLALESFGARAYAKNLSFIELEMILNIAHALDKKVYVTVNTIIKNDELEEVYSFLQKLYLMGVDSVICADICVFMYIINNLKGMDAHISTQAGVKDLYDALFFENIGASRVVVAREDNIEEIDNIRKNSNIELEVFIHGALCVSYSGGCLFSSLLSLRSGNRGRCSQNCRRLYQITENNKIISPEAYYLSMKDLCVGENIKELLKLKIDSFKIEGRMKNISYVDRVTRYYKDLIDGKNPDKSMIEQIFHRQFTKGFIFNEDRKNVTSIKESSSVGKMVGKVLARNKNRYLISTNTPIRINERIRFSDGDTSQYLTVETIYDSNNKKVSTGIGKIYLVSNDDIRLNSDVYKMNDLELDSLEVDSNIIPLSLFITGSLNSKLIVTTKYKDEYIVVESNQDLSKSINNPLTKDTLHKQLSKLNDTPFYIEDLEVDIEDNLFISLSEINEIRRQIVNSIYELNKPERKINDIKELSISHIAESREKYIARVYTKEQYQACLDMGIKAFYDENTSFYVGSKYQDIKGSEVLVGNYGGLYHYKDKDITTDYSFNVINKDSVLHLLNFGVKHVTLSYEMTYNQIKDLSLGFYNTYKTKAPLDMIVYGKIKLMTTKYCPLKKLGLCGKCRENEYHLIDKLGKFLIVNRKDCIIEIFNDLPLNLINEIPKLNDYVDRFRFEFTNETYEEVVEIISNVLNKKFDYKQSMQTKGYFKRNIM